MRRDRTPVRQQGRRSGMALLDVVVSLAVLGLSGTGFITLLGQTSHSIRHVRETERQVRRAADELGRFAQYDRTTLVAMTGRASVREWAISVSQTAPDLFDVAIIDTLTGASVLTTTFYRPDTVHAP